VVFLESEGLYAKKGPVGGPDDLVPLGRAAVRRRGGDCTVVALSRMVWIALSAADALAEDGIETEVIDPRTLRPLDLETLAASVRRTGRAVIVEEGWPESGVAANLAARLYETCFDWLDAPIARVSAADVPMPYAKNLEQAALPSRPRSPARCAGWDEEAAEWPVRDARSATRWEEGTILQWLPRTARPSRRARSSSRSDRRGGT
jgi:pyruvate dehydrogenase E1 component beta subunit